MKFVKKSSRKNPKVSLVLLDWSVRESFHLLSYLTNQTVDRDRFEVIVVEYFSRISDAVRKFESQVDTWVLLEMPESSYYHKHLMYNVGIVLSCGEIVMIGDSDAMVQPDFISKIIHRFAAEPNIVYHMDQFRNIRRDLYPFNFPSFDEVVGPGCINARDGKTTGVLDDEDPVHSRNYGACMCARRSDLLGIGGADEHIDYLGHICGPYELTFRLCNHGHREVWETNEFTYHTWHPGSAGVDNYLGPHDGRHMSTTAFEALISGRIEPLVENRAVKLLRLGEARAAEEVLDKLIDPLSIQKWSIETLQHGNVRRSLPDRYAPLETYKGYRLMAKAGQVVACRVAERGSGASGGNDQTMLSSTSIDGIKRQIDTLVPDSAGVIMRFAWLYAHAARLFDTVRHRAQLLPTSLPLPLKIIAICAVALPVLVIAFLLYPRRILAMTKRLVADGRRDATGLTNLGVTVEQELAQKKNDLIVIVESRRASAFLRLLKFAGLLDAADVRRVRTGQEFAGSLDQLERSAWSGCLIVPASLFTCFYAVALRHGLAARMLIA